MSARRGVPASVDSTIRPSIWTRALIAAAIVAIANAIIWLAFAQAGATMVLSLPHVTFPIALAILSWPGAIIFAGLLTWSLAQCKPILRIVSAWVGLGIAIGSTPTVFLATTDTGTGLAAVLIHATSGVVWLLALLLHARPTPTS